jgi:HAD superfamily phosphatase (TIGR01668 family)
MSIFKPDAVFDSITKIDYDYLREHHIEGILLDIDNTLIDTSYELKKDVIDWVLKAKEQGFKAMILSNTNKSKKYIPVSEKLGLEYIIFAKKPLKKRLFRCKQDAWCRAT